MKKIFSFLTFAVMLVTFVATAMTSVSAADMTWGDYTYAVYSDGSLVIKEYNGNEENVRIPTKIDGKTVTEIHYGAFEDNTNIRTVTIPKGVKSIKGYAFAGCTRLESVTIPEGVTELDYGAFENTALKEVVIPDSVTQTDYDVFSDCKKLRYVKIGSGLTYIGDGMFEGCSSLVDINIPETVARISSSAFWLTGYYNDESNWEDDMLYSGNYLLWARAGSTGCYNIKSGTKVIAEGAFSNSDATHVTIPYGVTEIGKDTFSSCDKLVSITIPDSVTVIGESAFDRCRVLNEIELPDSITTISDYAFSNCDLFTSITIPDSVTTLGGDAFDDCDNLESICIPDSVTSIGDALLSCCYKLRSVELGSGVSKLPYGMFLQCRKLESVTLPHNIKSVGPSSFLYCDSLKNVYVFNKDCKFDSRCGINSAQTIYGYKGSTAQSFAAKVGASFVDIETVHKTHEYKQSTVKATPDKDGAIQNMCYCGKVKSSITIYAPKKVVLSGTDYTYSGKAKKPTVTVKDSAGKTLTKDTDYTVSYEKGRKLPGRYTVTVSFIGTYYAGTKELTFTVKPNKVKNLEAEQTISTVTLSWDESVGADGYRVYQYDSDTKGYKKVADVDGTSVKIKELTSGTKYKFRIRAYEKDNGTIYGNYSEVLETATRTKTPKIISAKSSSKGKATVKWDDVSRESRYQVYYATSKNGSFKKYGSYGANNTSVTVSGLTSGRTYYFKVRTYKNTDSGKVFSYFSDVKSVKVK